MHTDEPLGLLLGNRSVSRSAPSETCQIMQPVELYTASGCPHCDAAREDLEWRGIAFVEFDVERDPSARARMLALTEGARTVPVIVEEGKPLQVGWMGRGCLV